MIALHSVSKELGAGRFKWRVIDDLTWTIRPRSRVFVLGQRAPVLQLLSIISGQTLPTEGWVTRRATTSPPQGYLRFGATGTPRQLIARLSEIYRVAPRSVELVIEAALENHHVLDTPMKRLPASLKRELNIALIYAIPCDFYLLFGGIGSSPRLAFRSLCEVAFNKRAETSGIILGTNSSSVAASLKSFTAGAILYKGKFTLFKHPEDAITLYDSLEPEQDVSPDVVREEEEPDPEPQDF